MIKASKDLQLLFSEFVKTDLIPKHKCKQDLGKNEETHSINSWHNIVIVLKCE